MRIDNLKLKNFRNYNRTEFNFDNELILISGPNGSGKSNILEAIYMLSTAKSPRAMYDRDVINHNSEFCTIWGDVESDEQFNLELQVLKNPNFLHTSIKKAKINKVTKSIFGFVGIFNTVMFNPEDMAIILGSPSHRRKFLDLLLAQTFTGYRKNLGLYTKTVKQRNKILEMIFVTSRGKDQLEFWNQKLIELAEKIDLDRQKFFDHVKTNVGKVIENLNLNHNSHVEVNYKKSEVNEDRLKYYFEKEIAARSTLIGPHREDFSIELNGYDVSEFGSRGQQRTLLLALKLLEIDFIESQKGIRPVLLLDDIFSELDEPHRNAVIESIGKQQTFLTSAESVKHLLPKKKQLIEL